MAIRNFAPVYVNTCAHFDLEAAAKADGRVFCPYCEQVKEWVDRQGVLCTAVSEHQRAARRLIVVQLHEDKKGREAKG
jgi:uncharacterized Zn finger protein (UPF0148 family)